MGNRVLKKHDKVLGPRKICILDTNVLLYDPKALMQFEDNVIILPITVVEEADKFKHELSERGRNARELSRILDNLRKLGNLTEGVPLENGGIVKIVVDCDYGKTISSNGRKGNIPLNLQIKDNIILVVGLYLKDLIAKAVNKPGFTKEIYHKDSPVILVTMDSNLRVKADCYGLQAEPYKNPRVDFSNLYTGYQEVEVPDIDFIHKIKNKSRINFGELKYEMQTYPHQFFDIYAFDKHGEKKMVLTRLIGDELVYIKNELPPAFGFVPRNREQIAGLNLALDDDVHCVTLAGRAGTGKTLTAVAAGLQKVIEENKYRKLLISRPFVPMGKDLGFLPGDIDEKMKPWMQPIIDNLEVLLDTKDELTVKEKLQRLHKAGSRRPDAKQQSSKPDIEFSLSDLFHLGVVEIEPLTYIRGRSIRGVYLIVDEGQNLEPSEFKTIISRAGEDTKIVFTGDPWQIDNSRLNENDNGLSVTVEKKKKSKIIAHISMNKVERSPLAEEGADL